MPRGGPEGAGGRPLPQGLCPRSNRECHAGSMCFRDLRAHREGQGPRGDWKARHFQGGGGLGRLIYNPQQGGPGRCMRALFQEGGGLSSSTGLW